MVGNLIFRRIAWEFSPCLLDKVDPRGAYLSDVHILIESLTKGLFDLNGIRFPEYEYVDPDLPAGKYLHQIVDRTLAFYKAEMENDPSPAVINGLRLIADSLDDLLVRKVYVVLQERISEIARENLGDMILGKSRFPNECVDEVFERGVKALDHGIDNIAASMRD
jgi:hypothetical protein